MGRLGWAGVCAVVLAVSGCNQTDGNAVAEKPAAQQIKDILIAGDRVFPESLSADSAGNIYIGSDAGIIYRAQAGSERAEPWITPSAENGLLSVFGVLADDARGVLWVCSNPNMFAPPAAGTTPVSSLKAFALGTGALTASYDFPAGPAACNDIAVAEDGTVYATETAGGRIFRLAQGSNALTLFASGKELIGVDGIAFADDGTLYINNVRQNLLQRVLRTPSGAYEGLFNLNVSAPLDGPDGLRPLGGNRFLQSEGPAGRIALIEIDGDNAVAVPVKTGLDGAPGVTSIGAIGYALEGKIQYMIDPAFKDKKPGEFYIRAFDIVTGS